MAFDVFSFKPEGPGKGMSRPQLIEAAARVLLLDPTTACNIAGCQPAAFVQSTRLTYRRAGFNFRDDDLRAIHHRLRELVALTYIQGMLERAQGGVGPKAVPVKDDKPRITIDTSRGREVRES